MGLLNHYIVQMIKMSYTYVYIIIAYGLMGNIILKYRP